MVELSANRESFGRTSRDETLLTRSG